LYYTSVSGLQRTVDILPEEVVNSEGQYYAYSIQAASAGGHKGIVHLLLQAGLTSMHKVAFIPMLSSRFPSRRWRNRATIVGERRRGQCTRWKLWLCFPCKAM